MNIIEYSKHILFSTTISEKMANIEVDTSFVAHDAFDVPKNPGREKKIQFSEKQVKFPKKTSLIHNDRKAQALHVFANHELQAFEMMAAGILLFPTITEEDHLIKKGIFNTMLDEKKHFLLYENRTNDLGVGFGDLPIGNFFWKQLQYIKTPAQYYAFVALTLEAANLDFAKYYSDVFTEIEDHKTAKILDIVYQDEISHVAIGRKWLNKWKEDKTLWQYYLENLPELITPARSKGMIFDSEGRKKAGLDSDFITTVANYRDDFSITDRKAWKS